MLTAHEIRHINATLLDIEDTTSSKEKIKISRDQRNETELKYIEYTVRVKNRIQGILASGTFPKLKCPCDIHRFLETERVERVG